MSVQRTFKKLLDLVKKRDAKLKDFLETLHPSDLAELVEDLNDEQKQEFFDLLTDEDAATIIQEMEEIDQVTLFRLLTKRRASAILKEMATDDAADLLRELSPDETRELLILIDKEADDIRGLMQYPEDTAGGIMTTEFISLDGSMPVESAITRLREIAPEAETIYYIYVTDEKKHLTGVVSLRELIGAQDGVKVEEIMQKHVISVNVKADQEEVARVVSKYNFLAVPVVGEQDYLLGIVTVDDVLDVMEEEATEDIYHLVGTTEIEGTALVDASVLHIAGKRLPWLIICLFGGLISGGVIGTFEETLKAVVALAFFIPVIMDTGGNVGAQSSTVFVRGLATGEINSADVWKYFFREARVGLTMGMITGAMSAMAAVLLHGMPVLGAVVGLSMFTTVSLAAVIGIIIPLLFSKLGLDPAITSGPFVTTIKGITGLLIYFLIARALMGI